MTSTSSAASSSTTSQPAGGQRKLRLSCDNCYAAKVGCKRAGAVCIRCENADLTCVFSYSKRAGKPRKADRQRNVGGPSVLSANLNAFPATNSPASNSSDFTASISLDDDSWMSFGCSTDLNSSGMAAIPTGSRHASGNSEGSSASVDQSIPFTYNSCFDWESNAQTMSALGDINLSDSLLSPFDTDPLGSVMSSSPQWSTSTQAAGLGKMSAATGDSFMGSKLPTPPDSTTANASVPDSIDYPPCACATVLRETLSMLETSSLSFDRLLAVNRSAVAQVGKHLCCRCPPDIASIMLLSVILTKVVQWYERAKNEQESSSVGVTLGSLKLSSDDERDFRILLIRSELWKITVLITKFEHRFERHLDHRDKEVYVANMAFLRQRLQQTNDGL